MTNYCRLNDETIQELDNELMVDPTHACEKIERLLSDESTPQQPIFRLQLMMLAANFYLDNEQLPKSLKHIRQAYRLQQTLETDDYLAEILHVHALIFWKQAKYYSALQFWTRTLELSAWSNSTDVQIQALIGLGNVWRATSVYNLAKVTHELAVKIANHTRQAQLEIRSRIFLSWDLYLLKQYPSMLTELEVAEDLLKSTPNNTLKAQAFDFRAAALLELDCIEDAHQATTIAQTLAETHGFDEMHILALINKAKIDVRREMPKLALEWLVKAENIANANSINHELLTLIYYQQSVTAESLAQYKNALNAYQRFRFHSLEHKREAAMQLGLDKARKSKSLHEQRARKIINRLRGQYDFDSGKQLPKLVSETLWWERLVEFKTQLKDSNYSVIMIQHASPEHVDSCTETAHSLSGPGDYLARLDSTHLGWLINSKGSSASELYEILRQMLMIYPWERQGLAKTLPSVSLHNILMFPFTLEQLELEESSIIGQN
ncbi:MAG: tetratricopeptide repeat protein [Vibrio sp.]